MGSNPTWTTVHNFRLFMNHEHEEKMNKHGLVMELVDMPDSKSGVERRKGSIPFEATNERKN